MDIGKLRQIRRGQVSVDIMIDLMVKGNPLFF